MIENYYLLSANRVSIFDFLNAARWLAELNFPESSIFHGHQLRVAYIAARLSEFMQLSHRELKTIIKAALLHDIGLVFTARVNSPGELSNEAMLEHSEVGAWIVSKLEFLEDVEEIHEIIRRHHTKMPGVSDAASLKAAMVQLADKIDVFQWGHKQPYLHKKEMVNEILSMPLPEEIKETGVELIIEAPLSFWFDLNLSDFAKEEYLKDVARWEVITYDMKSIRELGEALITIIDFRSPVTSTHSTRVAAIGEFLARAMDLPRHLQVATRVAGYLHDVGKVSVPVSILEKPGPLTRDEYMVIQQHVYYTYLFFKKANLKGRIANMAAFHHERMDGSGYPFGLSREHLTLEERILQVADVMAALCEKRPYKKPLSRKQVLEILKEEASAGRLCNLVVEKVESHFEEIYELMEEKAYIKSLDFLNFMDTIIMQKERLKGEHSDN